MRYFDSHRRRLIAKKRIHGSVASVSGSGTMKLENVQNAPFKYLEICGKTVADMGGYPKSISIPTGITVRVCGTNLINEFSEDAVKAEAEINGYECYDLNPLLKVYTSYDLLPLKFPVNLKKGTYTIKIRVFQNREVCVYDSIKWGVKYSDGTSNYSRTEKESFYSALDKIPNVPTDIEKTVTFEKDVSSLGFCYYSQSNPVYIVKGSLQINEGENALEYAPYIGESVTLPDTVEVSGSTVPIEMKSAGKAHDSVTVKDGRVTYAKNIGSCVFNGTEEWQCDEDGSFCLVLPDKKDGDNIFCTHCKTASDYSDIHICGKNGGSIGFYGFTGTLDNFKAWLSENAVTVLYELAAPEKYDLTEKGFALDLLSLRTYAGTDTYIKINSNPAGARLEAEYYTSGDGDMFTLTLVCRCGEQTLSATEHLMRKNTLYEIAAPQTDGYICADKKIGVLDSDKTLVFEYTAL